MNRRKPSFTERRILSSNEAAAYLGRSASWLADHSGKLEKAGFPKRNCSRGWHFLVARWGWM
jgi:hypothetical protein